MNGKEMPVEYSSLTEEERLYLLNRKESEPLLQYDPKKHKNHWGCPEYAKKKNKKEMGMKVLINKKQKDKDILLAFTDDDVEALRYLYEESRIWGFYQLVEVSDKNKNNPQIANILKLFPTVRMIGYLADHIAFKGS
jgi:hypothetical protein